MQLKTAFDTFQTAVNAEPAKLTEARRRRDLFRDALSPEADVDEAFPSGSLARGSQLEPIHDVDVVIVYDGDDHSDWGQDGDSAAEALSYVGQQVNGLLGATNGTHATEVRLASPRNHAVKCFLDDPASKLPFTVDVMPALRRADGTLLIPEKLSRCWVPADPQDLIRRVRARHERWNRFVPLVRALKHWSKEVAKTGMKSLVVEVLALSCIPDVYETDDSTFAIEHRPEALMRFFTAAVVAIDTPVEDPAGLCGVIQPDLDVDQVRDCLQEASDGAYRATAAVRRGDVDGALCEWRGVLGDLFPEPPGGCDSGGATGLPVAPRLIRDTPQGCR